MATQRLSKGARTPTAREPERWHVGKEIPIALIFAVVMQTLGGIWWMSQLSLKLDNALLQMADFKVERYTREDARRDRELMEQKMNQLSSIDHEFDRRLNVTESKVERIDRK
jgi:hypothetical protein